jgi:hypothetical protein
MGKMIEMVKLDDDRQVATTVLDSIKEMLDEIKEPVLTCIERPDILIAIIKDVFQRKVHAFTLCFIKFIPTSQKKETLVA